MPVARREAGKRGMLIMVRKQSHLLRSKMPVTPLSRRGSADGSAELRENGRPRRPDRPLKAPSAAFSSTGWTLSPGTFSEPQAALSRHSTLSLQQRT